MSMIFGGGSMALTAGDLPSGIDAAKLGAGNVSNTELATLDGVTSAIQTQLDSKTSVARVSDVTDGIEITNGTDQDDKATITADINGYGHISSSGNITYLEDTHVYLCSTTTRVRVAASEFVFQNLNAGKGFRFFNSAGAEMVDITGTMGSNAAFRVYTDTLGFHGVTPVAQAAHITDADGTTGGNQTAINAILTALENLGLVASS